MALSANNAELSAKLQESLGLPPGFKIYSPFPFGGMNQGDSRSGMPDNEFFVRENFIKIGAGQLRTVWDNGAPIYRAPIGTTIVFFIFFNIAAVQYVAVFLSDGTAVQVNVATQVQTIISAVVGTFYNGGNLPAACQSGSQYLLIANDITQNSYWIWDGAILYSSGSIGPVIDITDGGSGYSSAPTVTAFGGSGSGIVATATIAGGSVVAIVITNPGSGYLPGDVVQFAFSGGGSDNSAILTAVLSPGNVNTIQLLSPGSGFTAGTYALTFTGGAGSGATGTYTVDSTQTVVSVVLTSGGSNYTGTPAITFAHGGGSGATASATLSAGSVSSVTVNNGGTNFTGTPDLTFIGGGGTGATATANLTAGVISSVTVTAGGSGYTEAPAVEVENAVNNAAAATANLMPFGVSGSSIETFQGRVWLPYPNQVGQQNNGGVFLVSAPSSLTDFSTSDGGLIFTSTDRFLRVRYTNIRQSNGYLYPFGDSSVDIISNVQTTGSPSTTTFNYQNTDPQIGTSWRDTLQDYSRTILFANSLGVFGLYGGAVTKISAKMDNIFSNAIFPPNPGALTPVAAVANIFTLRCYFLLMTIQDPLTFQLRNVIVAWDEKEWFLVSQSTALVYIGTQEVSSVNTAWGTDGSTLFPLCSAPSATLQKKLSTKLYGAQDIFLQKLALDFYVQAYDKSANNAGISIGVAIDNENTTFPVPAPGGPATFPAPNPPSTALWAANSGNVGGFNLGMTLASTSPDFTIENIALAYQHEASLFG